MSADTFRERLRWRWTLFVVRDHWWNQCTSSTARWNADKPHRCPACHTVVKTGQRPTWRAVYECCRCATRFARWPILARTLTVRTCADIPLGVCPHRGGGA